MASVIPAWEQAMQDARLAHGHTREVYHWIYQRLDVLDFRPMKLEVVMLGVRIEKASASRAMHRLVDCGYLAVQRSAARGRAYRLVHSVTRERVG